MKKRESVEKELSLFEVELRNDVEKEKRELKASLHKELKKEKELLERTYESAVEQMKQKIEESARIFEERKQSLQFPQTTVRNSFVLSHVRSFRFSHDRTCEEATAKKVCG